jgi:hypothetical protein
MTAVPQTSRRHIDDYLGPGDQRFFGEGFRRIRHTLSALTVDGAADDLSPSVHAVAGLHYPPSWSTKQGGTPQRPHLSSIDALVIGAQLAEAHLVHAFGLDPDERRASWIRRYTMRAGASPHEDLADFDVTARLSATTPHTDPLSSAAVSVFDCRIGAIKVRYEIVHPAVTSPRAVPDAWQDAQDLLGAAEHRLYGLRYQRRHHTVDDIRVTSEPRSVTGLVQVEDSPAGHPADPGVNGAADPSLSLVDATIVLAQFAQVLLYELDGLERGDSATLWMRRIDMTAASPLQPMVRPFVSGASITATRTLPMGGDIWRTADFSGGLQGIHADFSLAHRLPGPPSL